MLIIYLHSISHDSINTVHTQYTPVTQAIVLSKPNYEEKLYDKSYLQMTQFALNLPSFDHQNV